MNDRLLYYIIDWIGNLVERAGPAIYKLLALVLPYLSPLPIAAYTSNSVTTFLGLTPRMSVVFVFVLEAVGLWVTTMLVESVIDWIISRNKKVVVLTIVFSVATVVYVVILVSLNVSLKSSLSVPSGVDPRTLSRVVTLICFIPLLTGVCNGAYRLKLKGEGLAMASISRAQEIEEDERAYNRRVEDENRAAEFKLREQELNARHEEKMKRVEVKKSASSVETKRAISGVYEIRCTETGDVYIGASKDIESRLQAHLTHLIGGYHPVEALQQLFDHYGEASMELNIIEECEPAQLKTREMDYIADRGNLNAKKYSGYPDPGKKRVTTQAERGRRNAETKASKKPPRSPKGEKVLSMLDGAWNNGKGYVLSRKELVDRNIDKSTAWRWRKFWLEQHPEAPQDPE